VDVDVVDLVPAFYDCLEPNIDINFFQTQYGMFELIMYDHWLRKDGGKVEPDMEKLEEVQDGAKKVDIYD
jgi:hypothetical protein